MYKSTMHGADGRVRCLIFRSAFLKTGGERRS